jgi:hypothetical protein
MFARAGVVIVLVPAGALALCALILETRRRALPEVTKAGKAARI